MDMARLRTFVLSIAASAALAGCAYDDGYGYGGVSVGYGTGGWYDPWYYDDYYPRYYGWYDGFYYPGAGYYVYDRKGHRHRWSDGHRRHWEGRRHAWRGNDDGPRENWRGYRRDLQAGDLANPGRADGRPAWRGEDRRDFRRDRGDARRDLRAEDFANPGRGVDRSAVSRQDRGGFRRDPRAQDLANPGRGVDRSPGRQRSEAVRAQPQRVERGEGRGMSARARSGERSSTGRGGGSRQRD